MCAYSKNLLAFTIELHCSKIAASCSLKINLTEGYQSTVPTGPNSRIEGLNCMDNRTLNFFSADVATQRALMKSMGLNEELSGKKDFEAVIVDAKMETVYVMDEKRLDRNSLQDFIYR